MTALETVKRELSVRLSAETGIEAGECFDLLEKPKKPEFGELAFPCFALAKRLKVSPV
ncbi:MAG: hypothetical protein KDD44_15470, partial [Bdellovibrionales bacterium]|nr:hypothetical protein [Bdellovibrionales bacterium]